MTAVKEEPQPKVPTTDTFVWRAEQFEHLGFGFDESLELAHATRANGFLLYWGDVKKMLDAGATHAQIVDWFTYPTDIEMLGDDVG